MANIIKQIVNGNDDAQTIKMIVQPAERGPQGPQGPRGPQGPQGLQGLRGEDGVIHYRAGVGIKISDDNFISATGEAIATWGGIEGNINDQADLQQEFSQYEKSADLATVAESGDYNDLTNKPSINNATLTIQNDGTTVGTFTANSSTDATANIVPPVRVGSVLSEPTDIEFVDTANIVDGAVTANKIDFSTFGNQASYVDIGAIRIQFGTQTDGKYNANTTVTLPMPFADTNYSVSTTNQFNETGTSRWIAFVTTKSTSSFTFRAGFLTQNSSVFATEANARINWIAIGLKPNNS